MGPMNTAEDARSAIHVLDLVVIDGGWYRVPSRPGYSAQMQPETLSRFAFAAGAEWAIGKE